MRSHQTVPIHQQQHQHQHQHHQHQHQHQHQHHQNQHQHPHPHPHSHQHQHQHHQLHQLQFVQEVTIDENDLSLSGSSDANGRIVNILHPNGYTSHTLCRQGVDGSEVQLSAEAWGAQLLADSESANEISEQLTDEDRNLAAALVQFVQRQPLIGALNQIEKVVDDRTNSETSNGLLEHPIRLYHSPDVEENELGETDLVDVPSLQSLPPLPPLKRTHDSVWYHSKTYKNIEDVESVIEQDECEIEVNGDVSLVNHKQQNRKSLPHKKRISKKLKKHTSHIAQLENEHDVPDDGQQSIEIIHENISNDVHSTAEHTLTTSHMVHNTTHTERALFICQLCGQFYGEDQLQFFHHLKQHYEPNSNSIMLDNMQHDDNAISMDKIDDSLVVANAPLPDSLVELSLDDTNKTLLYQSQAKIPEYDSSEKSLFNTTLKNSLYSIDDKVSLFQTVQKLSYMNVDKMLFACTQCPKTFKRQKLFEAHTKDAHSKTEEMSEFSEPEDLMEGIHVVEPDNEEFLQEDLSSQHSNGIMLQTNMDNQEQYILPHLTIDHGSIHQSHLNSKEWFKEAPPIEENPTKDNSPNDDVKPTSIVENNNQENASILMNSNVDVKNEEVVCPMCHGTLPTQKDFQAHAELCNIHFKDDIQSMMDVEISDTEPGDFGPVNGTDVEGESEDFEEDDKTDFEAEPKKDKKALLTCMDCGKQFRHRNSIVYHMLSHEGNKPFQCEVCQKSFFTACALKVHARLHTGVRPYKCIDCGKKFRQWGDLKYHFISIHSNLKQHQCEYCGKNFARKYSLIIHRRIHTGEKNYRCEFCNKTFRASSYLQNHRKIHTGEKPYPCDLCGKRFRMKGDMRRHIKIHTKTKPLLKEKEKSPEKDENSSSSSSAILKSKPTSGTLLQDSKEEMKIEKEEAQVETEHDDNSDDVKRNVANEETASSPPSDAASREDTKLSSNFPIDNNGAMYVWPLFIS